MSEASDKHKLNMKVQIKNVMKRAIFLVSGGVCVCVSVTGDSNFIALRLKLLCILVVFDTNYFFFQMAAV